MPVAPPQSPPQIANPMVPLPHGVVFAPGQTQSTNTSSQQNPSQQVIGTDAQPFSVFAYFGAIRSVTLTFPNLPKRATRNNPITPLYSGQNLLTVRSGSYLLFTCSLMGGVPAQGAIITVTPQAITQSGVRVTGPFLGSERFITFQAVVTVKQAPFTQTVQGTVFAQLSLSTQ